MKPCEYVEQASYYWGAGIVDPSEPEYVPGKGVPLGTVIRCRTIADDGEKYCPKHKALREQSEAAKTGK